MLKETCKSSLAATLMASLLVAAPGVADAKAKHKAPAHRAPAVSSKEVAALSSELKEAQEQISLMQSQMIAMQQRIDANAAPNPVIAQTQEQATTAQATADKALAVASATTATQAKTDKTLGLMKWAADTKVSGRMYFNTSYVSHIANGTKTGNTDNGGSFAIKRFYLGIDHRFNSVFAANLTTDVSAVSGVGMSLYIKKAYLEAKIDPKLVVRMGADDMPWIPYVEGVYGYRHIEQTLTDRTKFGTSSDWGVHVMGDLAGGIISYNVAAVDGGGYRNPQFTQTVDVEGRLSAKYKGFNVGVGGYTGKLGKDVIGSAAYRTYNRVDALAAYSGKLDKIGFNLGVEYMYAENKAFNSTSPILVGTNDKSEGYSAFASVAPIPMWSVFGKYERVSPSEDLAPNFKEDYFNVGLQWEPVKIVDIALVYKRDIAHNGAFATGDPSTAA